MRRNFPLLILILTALTSGQVVHGQSRAEAGCAVVGLVYKDDTHPFADGEAEASPNAPGFDVKGDRTDNEGLYCISAPRNLSTLVVDYRADGYWGATRKINLKGSPKAPKVVLRKHDPEDRSQLRNLDELLETEYQIYRRSRSASARAAIKKGLDDFRSGIKIPPPDPNGMTDNELRALKLGAKAKVENALIRMGQVGPGGPLSLNPPNIKTFRMRTTVYEHESDEDRTTTCVTEFVKPDRAHTWCYMGDGPEETILIGDIIYVRDAPRHWFGMKYDTYKEMHTNFWADWAKEHEGQEDGEGYIQRLQDGPAKFKQVASGRGRMKVYESWDEAAGVYIKIWRSVPGNLLRRFQVQDRKPVAKEKPSIKLVIIAYDYNSRIKITAPRL